MLADQPTLSITDAERIARDHFGVDGRATPLTSERDQNFLIESLDARIVLKIANRSENQEILSAQQDAMRHLATRCEVTPSVVLSTEARPTVGVEGPDGTRYLAWAITWLSGTTLASAPRKSTDLWRDFGQTIGALDRALADFDHPAIHRDFYWDLANAPSIIESFRPLLADDAILPTIDSLLADVERYTAPLLPTLPRSSIHNDLNDHNVLVGGGERVEDRGQHVTGIVDFGDMVYSYRVGDLAIASAYAMLGARDPIVVVSQLVSGFSNEITLTGDELAALWGLVCLRLCASVMIAAEQTRQRADNAYLSVSQAAIRDLLPVLAKIPFKLAEAAIRHAARLTPAPASESVTAFLERQSALAPILGADLRVEPTIVLDLSIASPLLDGDTHNNTEPRVTERVFELMRDAKVRFSIGRYNEPRLLYVAPAFALGPRPTDEHRTIHIGLDLFAEAGTPVFAPLPGVVHALADNDAPQDYGPVIILRHETDDGVEFFTLYGHLSRESLDGLEVGRAVEAGEQIATLGAAEVNGGWTPHLHLQIITDLLGLGTDFPGVAQPTQRTIWCSLCPDPNLLTRVPAQRFPTLPPSKAESLAARRSTIGRNLSIAYHDPVKIVRGWKQFLYDDDGRCFIDAYNNVPHVGHCHPRVVEAAASQMRVLNTNTRYLNDHLDQYAERLLATLPSALDVCYFVNSASEANELALRLSRAYTGARDIVVLDAAYHGNTTSLIDISPYKHAGPGGEGAPNWVHAVPLPDTYRGPHRGANAGPAYAASVESVIRELERSGARLSAFIAETCPSVGGQLIFPPAYLSNVYEHVRRAGGVCIADEVQTGLGRMGTSFWAFEDQDVVPDIVVMGKPLGNGHPIGAVATTRAIADAFDNGMEYFSTFGGNTVSCAVGIAVLDVLRDERLQEHACVVGNELLTKFRELADRHPIVGDVRGSGLFLGLELVRNRETLEPAAEEASFIANRMRERGVLLGTDGPYHNVVKIRPPMPFDSQNAEILARELSDSLAELPLFQVEARTASSGHSSVDPLDARRFDHE
jgi:4-aminobutyrate aminotransferase-like enzyme/Ser/Thr protein kinase RdoA (MazF antagonist)